MEVNNHEEVITAVNEQKNTRKRRFFHSNDNNDSSQLQKVDDVQDSVLSEAPAVKYRQIDCERFDLENFSDEVLFEIFKYLDSWSLMALQNCCLRFHSLILDRRFWNFIDLSKEPLPLGIIEDVLERTTVTTKFIKIRGPPPKQHVEGEIRQLNKTLINTFSKCPMNLHTLELRGVTIDFRYVQLVNFPKTLKRLMFSECNARIPECVKSVFSGIDTHLTMLEELGIEHNDWFEPYYIMIFSKIPALRWLSLQGCKYLSEFVPYGSMAARFGFKQLEYLDLRFTPVNDSDIQCFNAVATLREMLLDAPDEKRYTEDSAYAVKHDPNIIKTGDGRTVDISELRIPPFLDPFAIRDADSPSTSNFRAASAASSGTAAASSTSSASVSAPSNTSSSASRPRSRSPSTSTSRSPSPRPSSSSSTSSSSSSASASSASNSPNNQNDLIDAYLAPNRLVPHPDQYIYLDITRPRALIMHRRPSRALLNADGTYRSCNGNGNGNGNVNNGNDNNGNGNNANGNNVYGNNAYGQDIENVINHPLFWDIMAPRNMTQAAGLREADSYDARYRAIQRSRLFTCNRFNNRFRYITDRGICCFGRPQHPVERSVIWIRIGNRPNENRLERLTVRNYKLVTDLTLRHLAQCSPYLVYLDLSGTTVSRKGVQYFKEAVPQCEVVVDHLEDTPA